MIKLEELCPYKYPENVPPDNGSYFVVVTGWPNSFNGPVLLIGDYTLGESFFEDCTDKWRIVDIWVDYHLGYDFIAGENIIAWGEYPKECDI